MQIVKASVTVLSIDDVFLHFSVRSDPTPTARVNIASVGFSKPWICSNYTFLYVATLGSILFFYVVTALCSGLVRSGCKNTWLTFGKYHIISQSGIIKAILSI